MRGRKSLFGGLVFSIAAALSPTPKTAQATLVHDVAISPNYSNSINGIRITSPSGNTLQPGESLDKTLGNYTIGFKVENLGSSPESTSPYGAIINSLGNPVYNWNHSATSLNPGSPKYRTQTLNFSGFENGQYDMTVGAPLIGDLDPSNNERTISINIIPEPSILALLGLGALDLSKKRRENNQ